ncbi:GNAT family N-acetyltransferase [Phormidium sp. FACHB-592]|uniref:GNAT family N-acetyltransferase n=1 Tax=Stenomitos frigidus AS-A4 TaxID=2933935 RepID=A0ABV0KRA7_9CYAN|nr:MULTISPECIES: GNAT family N-acetyltransferase [Cyanophyceae]MBD2035476.1 GNAT family N-acetyltransferase [Leptolyngbya sp. FACHB-321]MBD2076724.1 GNAT family N-acetyltransferase [Phormidium sp. FACHB-592]
MIEIIEADLNVPAHAKAMVQLMDEYALDPMGGGNGLSDYVKAHLPAELAKRKAAHVILAFVDTQPTGLVVCLEGFSTFACQPLLNIHDVMVATPYRGMGLSKLLLQKAEAIAISLGCCKLTLEVLEGNQVAQAAYRACGFSGYELNPQMGKALFWEKKLGTVIDEAKHSNS